MFGFGLLIILPLLSLAVASGFLLRKVMEKARLLV